MSKGNVRRYRKNKGYESISRDMLQDVDNLSIAAMGLLSHLTSYPDNWKLYKTELYTRFKKSKRTQINNAWNELVEEGYIIQLRKRVGRKYEYLYFHDQERFTDEDINRILEEYEGYELWDGKVSKKKKIKENKEEETQNLDCRFSTVQNEQSKMDSPKSTDNKLTRKEIDYKKINYKEINQSINEEIEKLDHDHIKNVLKRNKDRLIDDKIKIDDVITSLEVNKHRIDVNEFARILNNVLMHVKGTIRNITQTMDKSIENELKSKKAKQPTKEIVPEWFDERKEQRKQKSEEQKFTLEDLRREKEKYLNNVHDL